MLKPPKLCAFKSTTGGPRGTTRNLQGQTGRSRRIHGRPPRDLRGSPEDPGAVGSLLKLCIHLGTCITRDPFSTEEGVSLWLKELLHAKFGLHVAFLGQPKLTKNTLFRFHRKKTVHDAAHRIGLVKTMLSRHPWSHSVISPKRVALQKCGATRLFAVGDVQISKKKTAGSTFFSNCYPLFCQMCRACAADLGG